MKDSTSIKRKELRDLLSSISKSRLPDFDAALKAVRLRKEIEKAKALADKLAMLNLIRWNDCD